MTTKHYIYPDKSQEWEIKNGFLTANDTETAHPP